jgi:hypothetical protein
MKAEEPNINIRKVILETSKTYSENLLKRWNQIEEKNEECIEAFKENNRKAADQMGFQSATHLVSTFLQIGAGVFGINPLFGEGIQKFAQQAPTMINSFSQIFLTFMDRNKTLYEGDKNIAQINKNDYSSTRQLNDQFLKDLQAIVNRSIQALHVQ